MMISSKLCLEGILAVWPSSTKGFSEPNRQTHPTKKQTNGFTLCLLSQMMVVDAVYREPVSRTIPCYQGIYQGIWMPLPSR